MGMVRQYVEQLSDSIGPRPVASDTERDAAEWIRKRFTEFGLNTSLQDFDTIRSLSGAYIIYALIALASVALLGPAHKWPALCVLLWVLSAANAVLAWLDFSGRGALSRVFPKGPSQNVVGRSAPQARPGEDLTKIVLVAHYDTERSTPLDSEGIAGVGRKISWLAHGVIMALPVLVLIVVVPLTLLKKLQPHLYPYNWYALLVICIPVLLMLLNLLIATLVKRYSPGANNNASGVAALLAVCERFAEPQTSSSDSTGGFGTGTASMPVASSPVTQDVDLVSSEESADFDATFDFDVKPHGAKGLDAAASSAPRGDAYEDYDARETFTDDRPTASPREDAADAAGASYEESLRGGSGVLGSDVIGGSRAGETNQFTESFSAVSSGDESVPDYGAGADEFAAYAAGVSSGQITRSEKKKKGGLFGRRKKKDEFQAGDFEAGDQPSDWLGIDTEYNAREEGRKIGSWDNFPANDDDDFDGGLTWKGGAGAGDLIEDGEYAATQAARIRRRISEMLPVSFKHKELWFVATSAHSVHSRGMRVFLEDYREELRGAQVIDLSALGAGDLYWSVREQAGKTYKSTARLTAMARHVARESNIRAKPYKAGKLRTEAGWALADGRKAMSLIRLTEAGAPFAAASSQDVTGRLETEKIEEAVEFVVSFLEGL